MIRALLLAALAATLVPGCAYDSRVVVTTRDPSRATIRVDRPDHTNAMSAGSEAADVLLEQGRVSTGEQTSADYALHGVRGADHSLVLRWDTRLPMESGENVNVLSPVGKLRLIGATAPDLHFGTAPSGAVQIPLCARLVHESGVDADNNSYDLGYSASLAPRSTCSGEVQVPVTLELPAAETTIHEKQRPQRGGAAVSMIVTTLCTAPLGLTFFLVGNNLKSGTDSVDRSLGSTFATVGLTTLIVGAAIDLIFLPTLLAPEKDQEIYPKHP